MNAVVNFEDNRPRSCFNGTNKNYAQRKSPKTKTFAEIPFDVVVVVFFETCSELVDNGKEAS